MTTALYVASFVAILATLLTVTRVNVLHALLYFAVSLLAVAVIFALLGAGPIAALEVIIYAGGIVALFVFLVRSLKLDDDTVKLERTWLTPGIWVGPSMLAALLLAELAWLLTHEGLTALAGSAATGPREVGLALAGPYLIGAGLASMVLLGGLVGARHIGRPPAGRTEERDDRRPAH
ncbi:MAG TPA: NADH-quinone oxidoreductase subunit J [Vicinamibacterales bacterium]|nr:NADH-quinone oxidoreductase subunit J [Vicinamibacterales bacterium]